MTRFDTRIVTALLARDSKDATYKFALLRTIVQCVTEQRAHKRIDENPFSRETGVGTGQEAHPPERLPSIKNQYSRMMEPAESSSSRTMDPGRGPHPPERPHPPQNQYPRTMDTGKRPHPKTHPSECPVCDQLSARSAGSTSGCSTTIRFSRTGSSSPRRTGRRRAWMPDAPSRSGVQEVFKRK